MPDVITSFQVLKDTPVPNILLIAGIIFLFLGFVGKFAFGIDITNSRWQRIILIVLGVLFIFSGVVLYVAPQSSSPTLASTSTTPTTTSAQVNFPTPTFIAIPPTISIPNESVNIKPIVGIWRGTVAAYNKSTMQVLITIQEPCEIGSICGVIDFPAIECTMRLKLENVINGVFTFSREKWQGYCSGTSGDTLQLLNEDQILWATTLGETTGTLQRINQ